MRRSRVGCDFGHSAVKLVQLKRQGQSWSVVRAELRELTPEACTGDDWPSRQAVQVVSECQWAQGEDLAVSLQRRPALVRYLSLPEMPNRELREALQWEAKKAASQAVEELVVDYVSGPPVKGEQGRTMPVTMVVADRRAVEDEFAVYRETGLRVKAMDVNPLSFYYAAHRLGRDQTGPGFVAFVDIGASRLDINIAKQGTLRFSRSVALGGDTLTENLARALGVDQAQAEGIKREEGLSGQAKVLDVLGPDVDRLVVEIQRSVDYYRAQAHDGALEALWIGGGTGLIPGFVAYVGKFFDANVRLFNPFEGMECRDSRIDLDTVAPRFIASVGLAIAGLA
ncbi:MAG TPA: type IV pilus assembly protein PilM [Nitrospiria bacterium]|nr:type IV pilus assembly protein PilM [Nitrospiria bacterium]